MRKSRIIYKNGLSSNKTHKSSNKQVTKIKYNSESLNQNNPSSESLPKSKIKYLPSVNYNLDAMKKSNEALGLSIDQINSRTFFKRKKN